MKLLVLLSPFFASVLLLSCAHGENSKYFTKDGLFLDGFDPVTYTQTSGPQPGSSQWSSRLGETTVHFVSQDNKRLFDKDPEKYIPAYNGYCAYAMADGEYYKVNPKNFKVIEGKTHLFYENLLVDTKKKWNKEEKTLKEKADRNWANYGHK